MAETHGELRGRADGGGGALGAEGEPVANDAGTRAAPEPTHDAGSGAAPKVRIPIDTRGIQEFVQGMASLNRTLTSIASIIAPAFAAIREPLARFAMHLPIALENARKNTEEVFGGAENLGKLGWTLPMNATLDDCRELLGAAKDAAALDAAFERFYFDGNGEALIELWDQVIKSPVLERWRPMLSQTRQAFGIGLFLPCVTGLLSVLDGLAHRAWDREFHKRKCREKFFADKMQSAEANSVSFYLWRSTRAFVDAVFAYADFAADVPPQVFNRHWILHGLALPSGDKMDCVRVLQAIHTFEDLVAET